MKCEPLETRRLLSVSLSGAVNIGTLSGRAAYTDSLSASNTSDVRKLTLSAAATLSAVLTGLTGNADLQLIKDTNNNLLVDTGETLASSAHTGTTGESLSKSLAAGTYFVRVFESATAVINYSLTIKSDSAGNSLAAARNVGALTKAFSFKDFVGSDDTADFYKFSLATTRPFTASLTGLGADANLQLIRDANSNNVIDTGDTLVTSAHTGTAGETISKPLAAGTYYLRVYRGSGDTNYSLAITPIGHLNITFNYSYDTSGFFTAHPTAKDRLNDAAATFAIFSDNLAAITPSGSNTWNETFPNPGQPGGPIVTLANQKIAANAIVIYVGGRSDLAGSELGQGGPGGFGASGTQTWLNSVRGRGQTGTLAATATDVGPWGGAVTFKSTATWNFNSTSPTSGQNDFFSVALHEMGHVFGIGTSASWMAKIAGNTFTGAKAKAANNNVSPSVDPGHGHFAQGTKSTVNGATQDVVMEPSLTTGTRRNFTKLDYAGLADVGWQVPGAAASTTVAAPLPPAPSSLFSDKLFDQSLAVSIV